MSDYISKTDYSKWSQALMKALVNLHGMKYAMLSSQSFIADTWSLTLYSAEAVLDSSLPRIVVIGEQSAGKRYVFNSPLWPSVS